MLTLKQLKRCNGVEGSYKEFSTGDDGRCMLVERVRPTASHASGHIFDIPPKSIQPV